jgi:trimethylamine:corrinoid methyltransferase-like protein
MALKGLTGGVYQPLSPADIETIHRASLTILENTDIPENEYDANTFYTCLKATGKHVLAGVNDVAGFHKALDIAAMVAGDMAKLKDKPFISIITSFAISPLKLCIQSTLIMQAAVRDRKLRDD